MGKDLKQTTTAGNSATKQTSFNCDIDAFLLWRRVFLIRYYKTLGENDHADITWQDFNKQMSVLSIDDDQVKFERKLPHKDLFKTVVEIKVNKQKFFVINLYYTTKKCHIQGSKTQEWLNQENEILTKFVHSYKQRAKGDYSNLDNDITGLEMPEMFLAPEDLDKSETFPKQNKETSEESNNDKTKQKNETNQKDNKVIVEENDDKNETKTQCDCKHEISALKEALHRIEQLLLEKGEKEQQILLKTESIEKQIHEKTENVVQQFQQKTEKIERKIEEIKQLAENHEGDHGDIKQTVNEIRLNAKEDKNEILKVQNECLSKITKEVKSVHKEMRENKDEFQKTLEDNTIKILNELENDSENSEDESDVNVENDTNKRKSKDDKTEREISNQNNNRDRIENDEPVMTDDFEHHERGLDYDIQKKDRYDIDLWVIGTSIVKDLVGSKMYSRKFKSVRITTLPEKTIRGAKSLIRSGKVQATNILLQVGSNDLDFENEAESVVREMRELVEECEQAVPGCKILVGEILPRFYSNNTERQKFERKRTQYNSMITSIKNITIVEHRNLTQVHFDDGVHLSPESGVPIFVRNIKEILDPILGVQHQSVNHRQRYQNRTLPQEHENHRQHRQSYHNNFRGDRNYRDNGGRPDQTYDYNRNTIPNYGRPDQVYDYNRNTATYRGPYHNRDMRDVPYEYGNRLRNDGYSQTEMNSLIHQLLNKLK